MSLVCIKFNAAWYPTPNTLIEQILYYTAINK